MDEPRIMMDLGDGMLIVEVTRGAVKEQEINAQILPPNKFAQLVDNIKQRGRLESLPYCSWPDQKGNTLDVVSGHHRLRAGWAAGLKTIPVLADTNPMTRSLIRAKQMAHNALVGESDGEVLRRMLEEIDNPDDLLATGLDMDMLPLPAEPDKTKLEPPTAEMEWRNVSFTFLPHQFENFKAVVDALDGPQDLLGVASVECYDDFAKTIVKYGRIRNIRSVGTTLAKLTTIAQDEFNLDPERQDWVPVDELIGTARVPAEIANLVRQATDKLLKQGDITTSTRWKVLEYALVALINEP